MSRKHGRNKAKCERYRSFKTRERNKLKRIIKNNSIEEAKEYAKLHGLQMPKPKVKQGE